MANVPQNLQSLEGQPRQAPVPVPQASDGAALAAAAAARGEAQFDPNKLTVEELRDELRARSLNTVGLKSALVERLAASISGPGGIPYLMCDNRQLKRPAYKKEPQREDFGSEEEFNLAWIKWRETRDSNNESVKRSRICAKLKKIDHEHLLKERDEEHSQLNQMLERLKDEAAFLNKVLSMPEQLDATERDRLLHFLSTA
eukprot:m.40372 g.40372  ORF g.40372 m.40372 type:complete len:201 (-) comp10311_c1_seq2:118-720(-)